MIVNIRINHDVVIIIVHCIVGICDIIIHFCNLSLTVLCYEFTRIIEIYSFFIQLMNDCVFTDSITIGINEWLIPQISEHCP